MKKIFSTVIILMLVLFLSIDGSASSASGSGGSSSGLSNSISVDFYTFAEENVYGSVGIEKTEDVNYGVGFYLIAENIDAPYLSAELYDEENNLLTDVLTENTAISRDSLEVYLDYNLENENANYTVKFWMTDEVGNPTSEQQIVTLTYETYDIRYGYVATARPEEGFSAPSVEILGENSQTEEFYFSYRPTLNNESVNSSDIDETEIIGKFAKFEVSSNGVVVRLNYYSSIASDNFCSVYSVPSTGDKTVKCVYISSDNITENTYVMCALFNNGSLEDVGVKQWFGEPVCFISGKECTNIKLMNWENLVTLKPVCDVSDLSIK